jgi:hemoglobin
MQGPSLVPDSVSEEQIAVLVDTFYARVRRDATLCPVFERVVGDAWEPHLEEKMCAFWSSLVVAVPGYRPVQGQSHDGAPQVTAAHWGASL